MGTEEGLGACHGEGPGACHGEGLAAKTMSPEVRIWLLSGGVGLAGPSSPVHLKPSLCRLGCDIREHRGKGREH